MSELEFLLESGSEDVGEDAQQPCADVQPQVNDSIRRWYPSLFSRTSRRPKSRQVNASKKICTPFQCDKSAEWTMLKRPTAQTHHKDKKTPQKIWMLFMRLRQIDIPDNNTCRRVDTCKAVTKRTIETARALLDTRQGEGVRDSICIQVCSLRLLLKLLPMKPVLKYEKCLSKNVRLWNSKDWKLKPPIYELSKRLKMRKKEKRAREAKHRQVDRLETLNKLKAATARQQVYEQSECSDEEVNELLHQCASLKEEGFKHESSPMQHHFPLQAVTHQKLEGSTVALGRAFAIHQCESSSCAWTDSVQWRPTQIQWLESFLSHTHWQERHTSWRKDI